jgi:A/G-specific adenine glycosylase
LRLSVSIRTYSCNIFIKMDAINNWNSKKIKCLQEKLLLWYQKHKRALPWRDNPSPYRVWISEIMLQQTQVKTMLPYYDRFLKRFPDVRSLAHASEAEVLELWAGLGYYSRARNLHKAARRVLNEYGAFPDEIGLVRSLPGIGRYTAGAICSIAFNQAHPIVDGNIRRVLIRLHGIAGSVSQSFFWDQMTALIPKKQVSSFNQAMMEIGALVCIPYLPRCGICPIKSLCKALKSNLQNDIPTVTAKRIPESVQISMLILENDRHFLITSSDKPNLIPGKWGFPCEIVAKGDSAEASAVRLCRKILGKNHRLEICGQYRHTISRYRISVNVFYGVFKGQQTRRNQDENHRWSLKNQIARMFTSAIFLKALQKHEALTKGHSSLRTADGSTAYR